MLSAITLVTALVTADRPRAAWLPVRDAFAPGQSDRYVRNLECRNAKLTDSTNTLQLNAATLKLDISEHNNDRSAMNTAQSFLTFDDRFEPTQYRSASDAVRLTQPDDGWFTTKGDKGDGHSHSNTCDPSIH